MTRWRRLDGRSLRHSRILTDNPHDPENQGHNKWPFMSFDTTMALDYRVLFEAAPCACIVVSTDFTVLAVSDAYLHATHREREDLIGANLLDAFPEGPSGAEAGSSQAVRGTLLRVAETGQSDVLEELRYDVQNREGEYEERYWRLSTQPLGDVLFHCVEDVTEKHRSREALNESESRFRTVADQAPVMIWVAGPDRNCIWFNRPWLQFTGRTMEEECGKGWKEGIHPDDLDRFNQTDIGSFSGRDSFQMTYRLRRHDGVYRWLIDQGVPTYTPDGTFTGYVGSCIDISAQVEAQEELEREVRNRTHDLQETVRESEAFNYSISHDLRAPLRSIIATSRILLDEAGPLLPGDQRELLERQAHNATRLGTVVDELLRLSRLARVEVNRKPLDMTAKARTIAAEVAAGCEFEVQEGMFAEGDPGLVRMVLTNLIENACKFSPSGGTVRVRQEGDVFAVSDEGVGFDMIYAEKLFLPFERLVTEAEFPGTGIGLANVERIIRRHGGRVWADSAPGKGATFYFTLG
ncbi:PAS domain S-box protein [bacterium]|nr:MAG: PAS domain S-box protein [bacterium]